jgi:peptidoglycan L-alanyl-D-glutamate endopeptidase CwlK
MTLSTEWLIEKANNKLEVKGMSKTVAEKVRKVIKDLQKQGVYVCVAQGYRSKAEQDKLYEQGRHGNPGKIVTNAKGGQSNHNFGVAVDLCLYTKDGKDVIWSVEGDFKKVITAMKKEGFKWGGDWKSFKDYPHFELYDAVNGEKAPAVKPAKAKPVVSKPVTVASKSDVKTIDKLAQEVIDGKLGSGDARKKALGSKYDAVQKRVSELLKKSKSQPTIHELALKAIKGSLGSGDARKKALGSKYDAVQTEINRILNSK